MAPEVLQGILCDSAVDWWSLGIVIGILMGQYPFDAKRIVDSIVLDQPILPKEASTQCKTFMNGRATQ